MEISVFSQAPTSKIIYELNEEFHQYQPPPNKILCSVSNKYNVFLSFRGKDVRTTFVDHLYESLSGAGLRVFLDSEELEKGKEIESSLETANATSDIFIPIFSRNYAESTWCLKEAAHMCRSNGFIIPLFYDVEPCDVRYPRRKGGPFEEAFQKHYSNLDRQDEGTIEEWKNALYKISSLSGWTRAGEFGYEGRLVKRVVKDVLDTLKITLLDVPEHLVGLQTNIDNLIKSLDLSSWHRTVKVGVIGIGGAGKTTLAKAVYNAIYTGFDAHCYAKRNTTLVDLQREILRSLVNYQGEVSSVDGGKAVMRNRLHSMPSLRYLVLQNTKVVGNIGNLVPNLLWLKIRHCDLNDTFAWLRLRNGFQIDGSWSQVRILSVEQCASLTRIPKTVDSLVNLQCFYLNDCVALTTLPNALGNLSQLQKLSLGGCTNLTSLPDTLGNLTQLKELNLEYCTGLRSLPTSMGNLTQLKGLDLHGCTGLRNLPNTVGNLAHLQYLFMYDCSGLQSLPYAVGNMRNLSMLLMRDSFVCWEDIERFHDGVFMLAQLRDSNRSDGLGRLVEKKYNVCIVCHAADAEEALKGAEKYKYLRSGSTRICRVNEDEDGSEIKEAIDNSDILVPILSQNFAESIMCAREFSAMLSSDGVHVPLYFPNYWSSSISFWERVNNFLNNNVYHPPPLSGFLRFKF